ncbi:MAG TPA: glycosyltransferase family 4 protein [Terriglobales bacterium]|jgi:D-inositol-3-phosphate glycosyltransferase|nr:glycosyltransferase family 4 protein [Terriglobales bacterium]
MSTYSTDISQQVDPLLPVDVPPPPRREIKIGLLTGGFDRPYAFGLAMALAAKGVSIDVIGGSEVDSPEMHTTPGLNFVDAYGDPRNETGLLARPARVLKSYLRILWYSARTDAKILHVLWNNKFPFFDRTLLMMLYKLGGKKIVFTAHNVNAGKRDGNDSLLNRLTLKIQYRMSDHIFVHTEKMKSELLEEYGVRPEAATVIPFGINNSVPDTALTTADARRRLGFGNGEKIVLFFGAIRPYKGLECLVAAFQLVAASRPEYRLIIAGESKKGSEQYWLDIQKSIESHPTRNQVIQKIEFVPDIEAESYFKAADVTVLSYTEVFQSGVLFLAYSFGLPVIASDVGSFRQDIIPGETGLVCKARDSGDLAHTLEQYFASELFRKLDRHRPRIRDFANARNSWGVVGEMTRNVYLELSGR